MQQMCGSDLLLCSKGKKNVKACGTRWQRCGGMFDQLHAVMPGT